MCHPEAEILGVNGFEQMVVLALKQPDRLNPLEPGAEVKPEDPYAVLRTFVVLFNGDEIYDRYRYLGSVPLDKGGAAHTFEVMPDGKN